MITPTRSSAKHWGHLAVLVAQLERTLEFCARLDAYRSADYGGARGARRDAQRHHLWERVDRLHQTISREVDLVTAELLVEQTRTKIARDALRRH